MYPLLRRAITITSTNNAIRFREGAVTATAVVASGVYWLRDTGTGSLLLAVKAALEAATASTNTYTVTSTRSVNPAVPTGTVSIARATGADTFQLLGANVLTTFPLHAIGFPLVDTALDAGAKTSTLSPSGIWLSNDMLTVDEPDFTGEVFGEDPSRGGAIIAGAMSEAWDRYRWAVAYVARRRVWQEANASDANATWESFWRRIRSGPVLELARLDPITFAMTDLAGQWVADLATRERVGPVRFGPGTPIYSWRLEFQRWVTP
jgi:hypothetical protein